MHFVQVLIIRLQAIVSQGERGAHWMYNYILKNMETLKRMPFKAQKSVFDKLEKIVDIASLSKEEREKYDESIKIYRDNLAVAAGQRELGREEGLKEGKLEGLKEVSKNLKLAGMSSEKISKITGLSVSVIEEL